MSVCGPRFRARSDLTCCAFAKKDRINHLETELENGSWKSIRRLRQVPVKKHSGIKNLQSELVVVGGRAESLAK